MNNLNNVNNMHVNPPPPVVALTPAAAAIQAASRTNASTRGTTGVDSTYKREWKKFIEFVTHKVNEGILEPNPKYLTRESVDLYFLEKVSQLTVQPKTAARIRPALQFYADRIEHIDGDPFIVGSPNVDRGLTSQKHTYVQHQMTKVVDPHKNLPCNALSPAEHELVLTYIYRENVPSWRALTQSWNLGNNTFIRGDTFLKLRLSTLYLNTTHGPEISIPGQQQKEILPMLTYILTPRDLKSVDPTSKNRMAGCWRHFDFLRCGTGAVAMNLFTTLHYNDPGLNFYDGPVNQAGIRTDPMWWKVRLGSEWKDTKVASQAYDRVLTHCNVSWGKLIHMRSAGIEHASARGGLDQSKVQTLSKHSSETLGRVYMTELFSPVLKVMAGFERTNDVYHVPRCTLQIPWPEEDVLRWVFPHLQEWRGQYESRNGDKSEACRNFLYHILPFVAQVVVQDGIYFVHHFPHHQISTMLREAMPNNYELWARDSRQMIKEEIANANEMLSSNLNDAAKASYLSLKSEFAQLSAVRDEIKDLKIDLTNQLKEIRQVIDESHRRVAPPLPPPPPVPMRIPTGVPTILPPLHQQVPPPLPSPTEPTTFEFGRGDVDDDNPRVNSVGNQLVTLRNTPRVPIFPQKFAKTVRELTHEYLSHSLSEFERCKMTHWDPKIKMGYGRRKYMMSAVRDEAARLQYGSYDHRIMRASDIMDERRNAAGLSTTAYLNHLKKNDPRVVKKPRNR
jgi:hypothetical protein